MNKIDRIINNSLAYTCLGIAVACIVGVIVKGAWWHVFSALICYFLYKTMYIPKDKENQEN